MLSYLNKILHISVLIAALKFPSDGHTLRQQQDRYSGKKYQTFYPYYNSESELLEALWFLVI